MIAPISFVLAILASPFKSKSRLDAENATLRRQLVVLRRKAKGRARLTNADRWFFVLLYRWFPAILEVLTIIGLETLVRWHRVRVNDPKAVRECGRTQNDAIPFALHSTRQDF